MQKQYVGIWMSELKTWMLMPDGKPVSWPIEEINVAHGARNAYAAHNRELLVARFNEDGLPDFGDGGRNAKELCLTPDGKEWMAIQGELYDDDKKCGFGATASEAFANWVAEHGEPTNPFKFEEVSNSENSQ